MTAHLSDRNAGRSSAPSFNSQPVPRRKLSTEELAAVLRNRPQTIRRGLCIDGHYLGLRPTKLANGRLLWDAAEVEALTSGEGCK